MRYENFPDPWATIQAIDMDRDRAYGESCHLCHASIGAGDICYLDSDPWEGWTRWWHQACIDSRKECPACDGRGTIPPSRIDPRSLFTGLGPPSTRCELCAGKGYVKL